MTKPPRHQAPCGDPPPGSPLPGSPPPADPLPVGAPPSDALLADAPVVDGWLWPPEAPRPDAFAETPAGQVRVRAPIPAAGLAEALLSALRAASRRLAARPVQQIATALASAGGALVRRLDDDVLREVAANAALSPAMAREVVEGVAEAWTPRALDRLLRAEFPDPRALDGFTPDGHRAVRAAAPCTTLHIGSGTVPGVTVTSMIRALLVKSAVLAKPGAGDVALSVRFAWALREADPLVGTAAAVHYWPGGDPAHDAWERALLHGADQAVVHGADAAIESVRARAPATTRLVEHSHRLGVAVVDPARAPDSAAQAARAAALCDQRGCVSAHLFLVLASQEEAARWCSALAARLADLHDALPPAAADAGTLSALHQLRGRLAMKRAASGAVQLWTPHSPSPTSREPNPARARCVAGATPQLPSIRGVPGWTVVLATMEEFEPVGSRTAWVVPAPDLQACLEALGPISPALQTVGLAGTLDEPAGAPDEPVSESDEPVGESDEPVGESRFVESLAALGATRIVPLSEMPFPDATWLHDGARPLGELVRWTEARSGGAE